MMADYVAALLAYLKADTSIAALVGELVFCPELNNETSLQMPTACIVFTRTGGSGPVSMDNVPLISQRVDFKCYGRTPNESDSVYRALRQSLKGMNRAVHVNTLLHQATEASAAMDLREPQVDWPMTFSVWNLVAGEVATA